MTDLILRKGQATATLALRGAEPVSWQVEGRELIWHGDPAHWSGRAPILFPVVGASAEGRIRVGSESYPMPQHGFARGSDFHVVAQDDAGARLRLLDSAESRRHYPFAFRLDVAAALTDRALALHFEVHNPGDAALPYALGFHPAFPWPSPRADEADRSGHRVEFEAEEEPFVPTIREGGVLDPDPRPIPLEGRRLPLDPELFAGGALIVREARSRAMRFVAPSGAAIGMEMEDFPHLALWTRPTAPFLSMEAWTGHADWIGFAGELKERNTVRLLAPGQTAQHRVVLRWHGA